MSYKWLLFDADNTLMDFDYASRAAMESTFKHFGLFLTDDNYKIYKTVNHQVWVAFEKGEIDAVTLRTRRFELLFEWMNINPGTPKDFSDHYLHGLSIHNAPYDGVEDLLKELKKSFKLSIITNGLKECQRPNYNRRGWDQIFESIVVSDEIGVQKPNRGFFEYAWKDIDHDFELKDAIVIGDNIISDIKGAQGFGLDTCWINRGRENATDIQPSYSISNVLQLPELLK